MNGNIRRCKSRLFVGEGGFSYTCALLNKHSDKPLAQAITATDYKAQELYHILSEDGFDRSKPLSERIENLRNRGVRVEFNVDASKIDEHFKGQKFARIHWNCPYRVKVGDRDGEGSVIRFRKVVPAFFQAANKLQSVGNRVHISLTKDPVHGAKQWDNPIVLAAILGNYRLIRKRIFNDVRYPGYIHVLSSGGLYDLGGVEREFVFEKLSDLDDSNPEKYSAVAKTLRNMDQDFESYDSIKNNPIDPSEFDELFRSMPALMSSNKKRFYIKKRKFAIKPSDLTDYEFQCSTDDDSSDYYESDEDCSENLCKELNVSNLIC